MKRLKRVLEGFTTVCFGLIVLACSTGMLSWNVWFTLISLWPLLLIAIGTDIIGKGAKQEWLRVVSSLIVLGGLAWVVFVSPSSGLRWGVPWYGQTSEARFTEPDTNDVASASIDISTPVSSLTIQDERRGLVDITLGVPYDPAYNISRRGETAAITVESDWDGPTFFPGDTSRADILLGRGPASDPIHWEISHDTGVTDSELDLSELSVSGVDVSAGIAVVDLTLGEVPTGVGDANVVVDAGIVVVKVRVPEGAEFLVDGSGGLVDVEVEGATRSGDGPWKSAGYDTAEDRYMIRVSGGLGSLDVSYY